MPSWARSAGIGAIGAPAPSSASTRWMTVSWAIRRIQNPTVWSGPYQVNAADSGARAGELGGQRCVGAVEQRAGAPRPSSPAGGHGSGAVPSRMHSTLCR